MSPKITTGVLFESNEEAVAKAAENRKSKFHKREFEIVWRNVLFLSYCHIGAIYGLWLMFTTAKFPTSLLAIALSFYNGFGTTAGAHRLWSHRSYKAKWPLRLFLMIGQTIAFQDAIVDWCRNHRLHHKYSDTEADPHNAKRGFFFSHVGWLLVRKHSQIKEKGKNIDFSDLHDDPIVSFQKKYYRFLMPLSAFIIPVLIPMYFWGESFKTAHYVNIFRYAFGLNVTWLVNSAAHIFGNKPYDQFIKPAENRFVSVLALGEGWHNFHHTFPWDYKTSELGKYGLNYTTAFLDLMAKIGLAYEFKAVPVDMIKKRIQRTGDGSHQIWGWGDKDQSPDDYEEAIITHKKAP